jgi:hypothetical protein
MSTKNEEDLVKQMEAEIAALLDGKSSEGNVSEDSKDEDNLSESELDEDISKGKVLDRKTVKCKICSKLDVWTCDSRYNNGLKKWRDSSNKLTNGRMCATCNVDRAKHTMIRTRASRKGL